MNELLIKIEKNRAFYSQKLLFQLRQLRYKLKAIELDRPIFILGCSRAGTTLLYKSFSESRDLGSLHKETHDFWASLHPPRERNWNTHGIAVNQACTEDRMTVTNYFYSHTGRIRIVDKNNQNGLSAAYLQKLFPTAHFVFIKRNPGDNINSLIKGWHKADEFATWSRHLPEKIQIENGQLTHWCFFLAEGWRLYSQANIEEVCAFQYRAMNEAILQARSIIPECQWHEIFYEDVIKNPLGEFQKLFAACDVPFDTHLKRHCEDVLQKPYNTFSEIRLEKWKDEKNNRKIQQILPSVRDIATRLGYQI